MEYHSRSVRLGDDVWVALREHELSANQLLRGALGLSEKLGKGVVVKTGGKTVTPREKDGTVAPKQEITASVQIPRGGRMTFREGKRID